MRSLPDVVFSARHFDPTVGRPEGALTFLRTRNDVSALVWMDKHGTVASQSPLQVFRAAECEAGIPAVARSEGHHDLVRKAVELVQRQGVGTVGGQLGRRTGVRYRVYERLKAYFSSGAAAELAHDLGSAVDDIYRYQLRPVARDILNRELHAGIGDEALARRVVDLRGEGRLTHRPADESNDENVPPVEIVCSLGLVANP